MKFIFFSEGWYKAYCFCALCPVEPCWSQWCNSSQYRENSPDFWAHGLNGNVGAWGDWTPFPTELWARSYFLSQEWRQVQQQSTPRAEGWRALEAPLLPPFPFQKTETVKTTCVWRKCNVCLEILVEGRILGVRKALPVFTTSGRRAPSGRSRHEVNRLGFSRTPVAFPVSLYNELDFWIRHFDCIWIDHRETAIPCPIPII